MRENKEQKYIFTTAPMLIVAYGVLQWPMLGALPFKKNICDMFFEKGECDVTSYADDNTPHTYDSDLYTV